MSQFAVTTTSTAPYVAMVWFRASFITVTYAGFHLCGPNNIRSAWCASAAIVDSGGTQWGFCWYHHFTTAKKNISPSHLRHIQAMSWGLHMWVFVFRVEPFTDSYVICWYLIMFAFWFRLPCSLMGTQPLEFATPQPSKYSFGRNMYLLIIVYGLCQEWPKWLLFPYMLEHTAFGAWQRVTQSLHFPTWWRGFFFPVCAAPNDMVNSNKPNNSGVVIRYLFDELTCMWSVEYFIAKSHIYSGFMDKPSTLTHFPLEQGC